MIEAKLLAATVATAIGNASNAATDPLNILLSYGPLGIIVLAFMMGWIHPASTTKRLEEELRRKDEVLKVKDEQIATLQSGMVNDAIPALIRSNDILHDFPDLERRIGENMQSLRDEVNRLGGKLERG